MKDLYSPSIQIIQNSQASGGGYLACPNFENYRYSWFRDGAYIAYSMDLIGEHSSAFRFHTWAAKVIANKSTVVQQALEILEKTGKPSPTKYLHTRYTLEGEEDQQDWPNNQLDGIGTWVWSLGEHARLTGKPLPSFMLDSAAMAVKYISAMWRYPCSDCWEEFPDQIHTYTLASIYAGVKAFSALTDQDFQHIEDPLRKKILDEGVRDGSFIKYLGSDQVDANLIALAVPYHIFEPDHPLMITTIDRIESELAVGGVRRYSGDTYYGGGEWVLLTAWLGWYWAEKGDMDRARELFRWVEAQADMEGNLPEQVPVNLNDPSYLSIWKERWGEIAKPLLWSHAKYLILRSELKMY
jgi:GH15 family glucan-1,4-alpha-glucosidase